VTDAVAVVGLFNDAINDGNVAALGELMTDTHCFIDSVGATVAGKVACLEAWAGFFDAYPDYRNVFDNVDDVGGGVVAARGHSECGFAALHGPAVWHAVVRDGLVDVWQVSEPAADQG
jgi:ketosteroid isomerase-like protein